MCRSDLGAVHARAVVYDNRVEHLWTYAQVASAMMMSIAHGSNDGMYPTQFSLYHCFLTSNSRKCRRSLGSKLQHIH